MQPENPRRISYILCTRNKLEQLRCTVPDLLAGCTAEDEIIVFDGNSTDGSREYLRGFADEGKFAVFRSEPDRNQAHALNKAVFLARGEIIKVVLDDDVLDYDFMGRAAEFFRTHPELDALGANIGLAGEPHQPPIVWDPSRQAGFEQWRQGGPPFWFQDQSFTYRRASIPLVGLWSTGVNCIDVEMTLRLTSQRKTQLAWYTGNAAVRITNVGSLSLHSAYVSQVPVDFRRLHVFYGLELPPEWDPPRFMLARKAWAQARRVFKVRTRLRALLGREAPPEAVFMLAGEVRPFAEVYDECKRWLAERNAGGTFEFLT